ncbi:hypothetical protein [Marivita sp.]|uniref:hypothetical protein n=1 Tax=Marivita sp. TaxID=2003365 RepID=UPI0025C54DB8|nr:hypothetical protein [Marivita sp.]
MLAPLLAWAAPNSPKTRTAGTKVGSIIAADIKPHIAISAKGSAFSAEMHKAAQYSDAVRPGMGEAVICIRPAHPIRMAA